MANTVMIFVIFFNDLHSVQRMFFFLTQYLNRSTVQYSRNKTTKSVYEVNRTKIQQ